MISTNMAILIGALLFCLGFIGGFFFWCLIQLGKD